MNYHVEVEVEQTRTINIILPVEADSFGDALDFVDKNYSAEDDLSDYIEDHPNCVVRYQSGEAYNNSMKVVSGNPLAEVSPKTIERYMELHEVIRDAAYELLNEYFSVGWPEKKPQDHYVGCEDDDFIFKDYEGDHWTLPISYLWDDSWKEELRQREEKKRQEAANRKQAQEEALRERELRELKRLKDKYE